MVRRKTMNNWLLLALLAGVVMVNVYFTYRRTLDVDKKGRMLLAALQLLYLVFIGFIFLVGYLLNVTGAIKALQSGSSALALFAVMVAAILVVFAVMLFFKSRLEKKIKEEHKI